MLWAHLFRVKMELPKEPLFASLRVREKEIYRHSQVCRAKLYARHVPAE